MGEVGPRLEGLQDLATRGLGCGLNDRSPPPEALDNDRVSGAADDDEAIALLLLLLGLTELLLGVELLLLLTIWLELFVDSNSFI